MKSQEIYQEALLVEVGRQGVEVRIGQKILIAQTCRPGLRPYLHPIMAPDGRGCLTEDSPAHHPWQHGLAVGLHGVSGSDFWFDQGEGVGRIEVQPPQARGDRGWRCISIWRHHQGHVLLNETQDWDVACHGGVLSLDLHWRLDATVDLSVNRCAYGGLFLRMPWRADAGSVVVDSEGRRDGACEQQPSRWVAQHLHLVGRDDPAGMAILDHPANRPHPCPWRVDGQRGLNPSPCIDGPWTLARGGARAWRYRILAFTGACDPARIDAAWSTFASETHP